eukprot:c10141_g1_i1.p1 GENE.c10141_g1_i1~~c10141_g1_i1.p1  ORF type:complete len:239 (-),score=32.56 c10141_g1_i1:86-802(-)
MGASILTDWFEMLARAFITRQPHKSAFPSCIRLAQRNFWSIEKEMAYAQAARLEQRKNRQFDPLPVSFNRLCQLGQIETAWHAIDEGLETWKEDIELGEKYVTLLAESLSHYGSPRLYMMLERVLAHSEFPVENQQVWGMLAQFLAETGHVDAGVRVLMEMTDYGHLPHKDAFPRLVFACKTAKRPEAAEEIKKWFTFVYHEQLIELSEDPQKDQFYAFELPGSYRSSASTPSQPTSS